MVMLLDLSSRTLKLNDGAPFRTAGRRERVAGQALAETRKLDLNKLMVAQDFRKVRRAQPRARLVYKRPRRRPMKTGVLLVLVVLGLLLPGCRRPYQDADLIGSWQIVESRIKLSDQPLLQLDTNRLGRFSPSWRTNSSPVPQTYTFSPDHTFTSRFVSTKDMRHFGVWALESDRLAITVLSNSFSPAITSNRESVRIVRLAKSVITLENRDHRDQLQQRTFRRVQ